MRDKVNELQIIKEQEVLGKQFRVYGDKENPLFLAKDVAEWIEYSKTGQGYFDVSGMLRTVDNEEKRTITNSNSGGKSTFLTEDGLYEVLMQSRKPIAKQFKKEVRQILKTICKTGAAIMDEKKTVAYYFAKFSDDLKVDILTEMYDKNKELQQFYDQLMNSEDLMDINTVAKELQIGEYKLFEFLRDKKVLFFNRLGENIPYERFRKEDKFAVKETICRDDKVRTVTYVARKGLDYILR